MAKFKMKLDFDRHTHSPAAHRAFVATALDQVKLEIGRGHADHGDITVPPHIVIGSWDFSDD